jgi:hypothetical protein
MARLELTFFLKGINRDKLIKDYQSGFFNRPIIQKNKLITVAQNSIIAPTYSDDSKEAIFTIKDRHNVKLIITSEGHVEHGNFLKTGTLSKGGRCKCCMEDYDYFMPGYPIAHEEHTILSLDRKSYEIVHIFWVTSSNFCSFECELQFINERLSRPLTYRDSASAESGRLLKMMYRLIYPGNGPLIAANDPVLLENQKGGLTQTEWKDRRHKYIRTDRIVLMPVKTEYLRQQLSIA